MTHVGHNPELLNSETVIFCSFKMMLAVKILKHPAKKSKDISTTKYKFKKIRKYTNKNEKPDSARGN